ncbi:hypothetical protein NMY22_g6651 [Coprinellus aureogranulatus]|nr:hypothetical protein NMY22_g6651 [Coprinellus aureogranulatus]
MVSFDVEDMGALEHIPNSVRLWKETVNLESSPQDARILLARAVEVIPLSVDLWLALARLETPDKAKAVLNKARKAVPTSHEIWIAAGRLLEQEATREPTQKERDEGKVKSQEQRDKELVAVDKTIETGVRELRKHQVLLTRDQWLKEAERCEDEGSPRTCEAIVKATVGMEIEEEDRYETWVADVQSCLDRGKIGTAKLTAMKLGPQPRSQSRVSDSTTPIFFTVRPPSAVAPATSGNLGKYIDLEDGYACHNSYNECPHDG